MKEGGWIYLTGDIHIVDSRAALFTAKKLEKWKVAGPRHLDFKYRLELVHRGDI